MWGLVTNQIWHFSDGEIRFRLVICPNRASTLPIVTVTYLFYSYSSSWVWTMVVGIAHET
jgi:hypothetical protein